MLAHTAEAAFWVSLTVLILLAVTLTTLPVLCRHAALKRASQHANERANRRIREADHVTDQMLQGVQGLLLTFHVATQKLGEDHVSRRLMEHALSEADQLVLTGCRRFEQVAFHAEDESRDHDCNMHVATGRPFSPERAGDR